MKDEKPSDKQIKLIREIEDNLGYEFNYNNASYHDAIIYISEPMKEYRKYRLNLSMSNWAIINGYD